MVLRVHIQGTKFIDETGRTIRLRGVNLGGSTKVPFSPNEATQVPTDFRGHHDVSFIGRPFPLKHADEHFTRLKEWGFNFIRLLTTWEAVEHEGPGKFDRAYLQYFKEIVRLAGEYGFYVFIDPHQDVWSRMTGGDGAPGWTIESVGMNWERFKETGAAHLMQFYEDPHDYPEMSWPGNYQRFATATMFTLFFGGKDFAPRMLVNGMSIQDFLQQEFIASMVEIAKQVKDFDHVLGFDSMNEPHPGFIGTTDLREINGTIIPGLVFTPFEAMQASHGIPTFVWEYKLTLRGVRKAKQVLVNQRGLNIWYDNVESPWITHGVWDYKKNKSTLLKPAYFLRKPSGETVNFNRDYLLPFIRLYTKAIREVMSNAMIFIEGDPFKNDLRGGKTYPKNIVNASHWYDGFTLFTKTFHKHLTFDVRTGKPVFLYPFVKRLMKQQLQRHVRFSQQIHEGIPTLIGEFGLPFDLNKKKAYKTNDFSRHEEAFTLYYDIMDELGVHTALWNYTADNTNEWGDQWNKEDLSIYSVDQRHDHRDINSGGRALRGFVRPYVKAILGDVLTFKYERKKPRVHIKVRLQAFKNQMRHGHIEIFVPRIVFGNDYTYKVLKGKKRVKTIRASIDHEWQTLKIMFTTSIGEGVYDIQIKRS